MTTNQDIKPSHYTVQDVAKLLQLHKRTVYDLCASGDIPSIRIGKAVRIPRVQFEAQFSGANR